MLFDYYMHKACHTSCSPELSINAKDTASEVALTVAQNTHKRMKSVVLCPKCTFLAHESVYLSTLDGLFREQLDVHLIAWCCLWCRKI